MGLEVAKNPSVLGMPIRRSIYFVLYPLSRLMLFLGVTYSQVDEIWRQAFVDAAKEDTGNGAPPTKSRVALLTGMTRPEASRYFDGNLKTLRFQPTAAARILREWRRTPRNGAPLEFVGAGSFSELCRNNTTNYTPRTFLSQFISIGSAEMSGDGLIRLLAMKNVSPNPSELFMVGLQATGRLLETIYHNLSPDSGVSLPRYQQLVFSRFIPRVNLSTARRKLRRLLE